MTSCELNDFLTRTGPRTPMGNLLRGMVIGVRRPAHAGHLYWRITQWTTA